MEILYNILFGIGCLILGYFFGSFQVSIFVGKVFFHQDPRDYGSHNAGGTNAGRIWGKKVGLLVIVLDMFKVIAPMWAIWAIITYIPQMNSLCTIILQDSSSIIINYYYLCALGCVIGHCWPIFANFKGGKGVSVFFGVLIFSNWFVGLCAAFTFLVVLKLKKYVSLSSITSSVVGMIASWLTLIDGFGYITQYGNTLQAGWQYAIIVTLLATILICCHKPNIIRLINREERKITWLK